MPLPDMQPVHVVNGDSDACTMASTALPGAVVVWRDMPHEGPLPPGDPASLRRVRAGFFAAAGCGEAPAIAAELAAADAALVAALDEQRETVLWFEHDLHDQLQRVQILARVADHPQRACLRLISIGAHPEHPRFAGLGELSAVQLAALWPQRRRLADGELAVASRVYGALRERRCEVLRGLAAGKHPGLPFLAAALARLLEERPWAEGPLGRSERQILRAVAAGDESREAVFAATWERRGRRTWVTHGSGSRSPSARAASARRSPPPPGGSG